MSKNAFRISPKWKHVAYFTNCLLNSWWAFQSSIIVLKWTLSFKFTLNTSDFDYRNRVCLCHLNSANTLSRIRWLILIYVTVKMSEWMRAIFKSGTPKVAGQMKSSRSHVSPTFEIKWARNRKYLRPFSLEISDFFSQVFLPERLPPSFLYSTVCSTAHLLPLVPLIFLWFYFGFIPFTFDRAPEIFPSHSHALACHTSFLCIIISPWVLSLIKALPNKLSLFIKSIESVRIRAGVCILDKFDLS